MKSKSQLRLSDAPRRPAYRTLEGWALGELIEQQAVSECEHHGHRRDRADPEFEWRPTLRYWIKAAGQDLNRAGAIGLPGSSEISEVV
jgi:hypothetical protein